MGKADQSPQTSLTNAQVEAMVYNGLSSVRAAHARTNFIAQKMQDLPPTYQNQLPATEDYDELRRQEQVIRDAYRKDWADNEKRVKEETVAAQVAKEPTVDLSGLSPLELIQLGLKGDLAPGQSGVIVKEMPISEVLAQAGVKQLNGRQLIQAGLGR